MAVLVAVAFGLPRVVSLAKRLFVTAIGCLVLSAVFLVAGWYHHHLAAPSSGWFNDVDAVLHHHVSAIVGPMG